VNLAEVLQHAREYSKATGLDPVALLSAFKVAIHFPDIEVARKVAALTSRTGLSLADRFAAATAEIIGGRLFTTDRALARAQAKRGFRVTYF
jgi:predicted nucleic acid-binding protein